MTGALPHIILYKRLYKGLPDLPSIACRGWQAHEAWQPGRLCKPADVRRACVSDSVLLGAGLQLAQAFVNPGNTCRMTGVTRQVFAAGDLQLHEVVTPLA